MTPLLLLMACGGSAELPAPVPPEQASQTFLFARHPEAIDELELPASARPGGAPSPARVPIGGPFKRVRTVGGVATWEAPIPIRPRNLFFQSAPPGMRIEDAGGRRLSFADGTRGAKRARTWDFTARTVELRLPDADGEPEPGAYYLHYDRAQEREDQLNLSTSGLTREAFACRSLQLGDDTRTGLYLPAPATAAWDVAVPPAAVLALDATVLPPEMQDTTASDGARLVIEISPKGERGAAEQVASVELSVGTWEPIKLDLSRWSGQEARVRFRTEGGASTELDYVFLAEPTLYTPTTAPRRLVMIFIDTLRPDHMSLYGYQRETTPRLEAWAEGAAVFDNARSIAPWTLPSARAALSGRQPELWGAAPILPELLGRGGWATGAFVGNVYLSANFEMSDGWGVHNAVNWPAGEVQIDKVEAFLDAHADRDAAVLLHLMDMHLPYTEPLAYRFKWADKIPPEGLATSGFMRGSIMSAVKKPGQEERARQYVIDRYDQNLRYLDDQLSALLESLGDDTAVVLFSDHGEEFWDHGGFEHGHSLYEELLRVPLIIKAPGVQPGRVEAPVSLLDLSPTVAELIDLDASAGQLVGRSLLPAAAGDTDTLAALRARKHAVGRPLYGNPRWGVISGDLKWTTHEGIERVVDLAKSPKETARVRDPDLPALRAAFAEGIGQDAPVVWRVFPGKRSGSPRQDLVVELHHPGGFDRAWLGDDPLLRSKMSIEHKPGADTAIVTFHRGFAGTREIYLDPTGAPEDYAELEITIREGKKVTRQRAGDQEQQPATPDGQPHTLLRARGGGRSFVVTFGVAPVPPKEGMELAAMDPEQEDALEALGYQERDEEEVPEHGADKDKRGDPHQRE